MPEVIAPSRPAGLRRAASLLAALTACLLITAPSAQAAGSRHKVKARSSSVALKWPRPVLTTPQTVYLGTGQTVTNLDPRRDYIVVPPAARKVGATILQGGR